MLVEFWRRYPGNGWHPEDMIKEADTVPGFVKGGETPKAKLHAGLRPQPYFGNPDTAKVIVLGGNPGCDEEDEASQRDPALVEYNNLHLATLRGEATRFAPLLACAAPTGAGRYWRKRLCRIARAATGANRRGPVSADDQLSFDAIAPHIALIEASAYPSMNRPPDWIDDIRSSVVAREYVREVLVGRARRGEAVVIAWRRPDLWKLEADGVNVFVRDSKATRAYPIVKDERTRAIEALREAIAAM